MFIPISVLPNNGLRFWISLVTIEQPYIIDVKNDTQSLIIHCTSKTKNMKLCQTGIHDDPCHHRTSVEHNECSRLTPVG